MAKRELDKNFNRTLIEVGSELTMRNITDLINRARFASAQAEGIMGSDNKAAALFDELQIGGLLSMTDVDWLIEDLDFLKLRNVRNILELYKLRNQLLVEKVIEERETEEIPQPAPPGANLSVVKQPISAVTPGKVTAVIQTPPEPIPATPGKVNDRKHKIFISFSFKDEEKASEIRDRIEKRLGAGSCWICTTELKGGDNMDKGIAVAIDKATVLVSLVSQNYTNSPGCEREVELARQQRTKFLPVLLERVEFPLTKFDGGASPMRMAFAQLIYVPLYRDEEGGGSEEFEAIIEALKEMLSPVDPIH